MITTSQQGLNFCTIISKNYLAYARVLTKSIRKHHPDAGIYVLLVDRLEDYFDLKKEPFELFLIDELPIPQLSRFCFQYDILELNTAAKPYFLKFLFEHFQLKKLVYLDPDIQVFQPMIELDEILNHTSIALTPHILSPYHIKGLPGEIEIIRAGTFNLGFIGLSNKETTHQMLNWWQEKLFKGCLNQPDRGLMVDQKWIDLVPSYFEDINIFRKDTYNVAYWNLHERKLSFSEKTLLANNKPCVFFHFSGYNPYAPLKVSKYQTRFKMSDLGEASVIYKYYGLELFNEGFEKGSKWPYAFNHFDNGCAITSEIRELYRSLDDKVIKFGDPFKSDSSGSFFKYCKDNKFIRDYHIVNGINLFGFFRSEKGTGQGARNLYRTFQKFKTPCSLINFDDEGSKNIEFLNFNFSNKNPFKINLFHINADRILGQLMNENKQLFLERYNIAFWNWELESFPDFWINAFSCLDEIWAPSTFTQKSIQSKSPIPVICIPYSINVPIPSKHLDRQYFGLEDEKFTFLFIFDCHSFFPRKNPIATIQAFKEAFENKSDVQLVIKLMHGSNCENEVNELKKIAQNQKNILFIDEVFSKEEIHGLINTCDVFVSLHRSEGFGLNICEAMALGKPVIATNYSANTDYMNDSNGYLVDYEFVAIDKDYGPYQKGEVWAEPSISHAVSLMKHIYENPDQAREKGYRAMETMRNNYSEEAINRLIHARLEKISIQDGKNFKILDQIDIKFDTNIINYPIRSHRPLIGRGLVFLRRLGRWIVKPALEKQTEVNIKQTSCITDITIRLKVLEEEIKELQRKEIIKKL